MRDFRIVNSHDCLMFSPTCKKMSMQQDPCRTPHAYLLNHINTSSSSWEQIGHLCICITNHSREVRFKVHLGARDQDMHNAQHARVSAPRPTAAVHQYRKETPIFDHQLKLSYRAPVLYCESVINVEYHFC